jgi:hypothetical protein
MDKHSEHPPPQYNTIDHETITKILKEAKIVPEWYTKMV